MTQIKCNKCKGHGCNCYPINQSNKTMVVPLSGKSAFETYLSYNPSYPHSEKYWVEVDNKGEKGDGVQIKGSVPTYADLLTVAETAELGDSWAVDEDGLLYTFGVSGFPPQGQGIQLRGTDGNSYVPLLTNEYFD